MKTFMGHLWRVLISDRIWDGAAILSFYFLLSVFPALLMVFYGASLFPYEELSAEFYVWSLSYIPEGFRETFSQATLSVKDQDKLSLVSLTFLASLWTAISGISAVIRQLNLVFRYSESRGYISIKLKSLGLALCLGLVLFLAFALLLMGKFFTSFLFEWANIPQHLNLVVMGLRFLVLGGLSTVVFGLIYSLGPCGKKQIHLFSLGSVFGALAFIASTQAFAFYLNNYGTYNKVYGQIGTFVGLIMWFYILGFLLIFGAEINVALKNAKVSGGRVKTT